MTFIKKKTDTKNKSKLVNAYIDSSVHAKFQELKDKLTAQGYDVSTQAIIEEAFIKANKKMEAVLNPPKKLPATETASALAAHVLNQNS